MMKTYRSKLASLSLTSLSLAACLLYSSPVFAQGGAEPPSGRGYLLPYMLVVLLSGMAVWSVCKSSLRQGKEE
jgi:hypothetical protein